MQRCDAETKVLATAEPGDEEAVLPDEAANAMGTARTDGFIAPGPPAAQLSQVTAVLKWVHMH